MSHCRGLWPICKEEGSFPMNLSPQRALKKLWSFSQNVSFLLKLPICNICHDNVVLVLYALTNIMEKLGAFVKLELLAITYQYTTGNLYPPLCTLSITPGNQFLRLDHHVFCVPLVPQRALVALYHGGIFHWSEVMIK